MHASSWAWKRISLAAVRRSGMRASPVPRWLVASSTPPTRELGNALSATEHRSSCRFIQDVPLRSNVTERARWGSETPTGRASRTSPLSPLARQWAECCLPPGRRGGRRSPPPLLHLLRDGAKTLIPPAGKLGSRAPCPDRRLGDQQPVMGRPTLVPLLTPTPQFGKTRIPVGDGAQPCRALERPRGREWAAGANRGTRTSACPDIAPLACTDSTAGGSHCAGADAVTPGKILTVQREDPALSPRRICPGAPTGAG